jgi:hypothetical protein
MVMKPEQSLHGGAESFLILTAGWEVYVSYEYSYEKAGLPTGARQICWNDSHRRISLEPKLHLPFLVAALASS